MRQFSSWSMMKRKCTDDSHAYPHCLPFWVHVADSVHALQKKGCLFNNPVRNSFLLHTIRPDRIRTYVVVSTDFKKGAEYHREQTLVHSARERKHYWLGHPKKYILSSPTNKFLDQSIQKLFYIILKTEAMVCA